MTASGLARFMYRVGRLKRVPRTGWLDRGVPPIETESVADHTFRVALLAWLAAEETPGLDSDRVLKLALLHDLAESLTGDTTPYDPRALDGIDPSGRAELLNRRHVRSAERTAAKRAAESAAMMDLMSDLSDRTAETMRDLWRELEVATSPEARFVKQVDKLETYLQSREYLAERSNLPMDSFAIEVGEVIDAPILVAIRDAIEASVEIVVGADRRVRPG